MFFKYLEPALKPFRRLRNKFVKVKQVKGNVKMDAMRVKNLKNQNVSRAKAAKAQADKLKGKAGDEAAAAKGKLPSGGGAGGGGGGGGGGGAADGAINPKPGVKTVGFFRKKLICEQCNQQLDKSWDGCPYCAQAAADSAPAPGPSKTQAFMIDPGGGGGSMQLLGWLVPVQGPQRGELFTLAPKTSIGTDPSSTVVLIDQYMSSHHAEIKAEGGVWVLKDLGSTNGTYVNDKRVDQQELVDNDFVKFGQALAKFKSL